MQLFHTLLAFLLVFGSLTAQSTAAVDSRDMLTASARSHHSKAQQLRRMDLFSRRGTDPFLSIEGQVGLLSTFSKDYARNMASPISLGVDYRFNSNLSVGLRASRSKTAADMYYWDKKYETRVHNTTRMVQLRLATHMGVGVRGEAYGGFGVAYRTTRLEAQENAPDTDVPPSPIVRPQSGLMLTGFIGGRYSLSSRIGITGQISNGISLVQLGLSYRLR